MSRKNFPLRRPKFALGIRLQEPRAGSSRAEWTKKWFAALERMDLGGRYGRGRNYAMSGQVVEIKGLGGLEGSEGLKALVQGARTGKYEVTIDFRRPEGAARKRVVKALKSEPMLVARLLAGELPMEVEEIFRKEGFDLYPGGKLEPARKRTGAGRLYDVVTDCSCPDYANPCKHVFAALTVLGEAIAWRPSLLVELRGIPMEELI